MNVALFIARRISLRRDNGHRRSPAVTIAVTGIALSTVIMLLTLAVVPGFKNQIRDKLMGFDAEISLSQAASYQYGESDGGSALRLTDDVERAIKSAVGQARISLSLRQPGILKTDSAFAGVVFHGYGAGHDWGFVSDNLIKGRVPDYTNPESANDIVISRVTADALGLDTCDRINTYFFSDDNLRTRRFNIAGIYDSHFGEYDKLTAYMWLPQLQKTAAMDSDEGSVIEIRGIAPDSIETVTKALQNVMARAYYDGITPQYMRPDNVYHTGAMYFNWLDLLDTNVIVIMILMGCVAGVTLVSCLFIMILERINLIGTLKAIGADNATIRRMFIYMAERIVIRGILAGNAAGLALVWLQWRFRLIPLDPEAYYLSYVPVEFNWSGIAVMNLCAIALSLIIMILPTHIVANISPSRVMRYE